jgi:penicillin-binding protein 1A
VAAIWGSVALVLLIAWYAYDLPEFRTIKKMTRQPSVTILDREGASMANFGGLYGAPVTLESVPPVLPHAVLAVEDRRFYEHFGIDVKGLLRAATRNLFAGRIVQGGSTLSQQLAKNLFLSPDRTLRRKVQELLLAFWLEYKFSKDQILTIYLNRVYLGAGTYGVDAAARRYFGKSASEVTLYEAALLAGLLKAPSRLNPAEDADRAEERTALVLNSMVDAGFIERAEADLAVRTKTPQYLRTDSRAPYFADWIMAQVNDYLGAVDRDIVVVTTLDPRLQKVAEEELTSILEIEGIASKVSQAALVSLDPTGAVRAMVGGRDYDESQFNRASQALRQPGSAFKPFVYLAAIEGAGFLPDSRMLDAPVTLGKWQPKNYGGRYYGEVTLRESFARSLNSVSVRIMRTVGPDKVVEAARRLGITTPLDPTGGIALGASEVTLLELTGAYATFVNQGFGTWPYGVEEIRDAGGDVLYRRSPVAIARGRAGSGCRRARGGPCHPSHERGGGMGHRQGRQARSPRRGKDRDEPGIPGRLVRRLYRRAGDGRLVRQRRQLCHEKRDRRFPAGAALGKLHAPRIGGPTAAPPAGQRDCARGDRARAGRPRRRFHRQDLERPARRDPVARRRGSTDQAPVQSARGQTLIKPTVRMGDYRDRPSTAIVGVPRGRRGKPDA